MRTKSVNSEFWFRENTLTNSNSFSVWFISVKENENLFMPLKRVSQIGFGTSFKNSMHLENFSEKLKLIVACFLNSVTYCIIV